MIPSLVRTYHPDARNSSSSNPVAGGEEEDEDSARNVLEHAKKVTLRCSLDNVPKPANPPAHGHPDSHPASGKMLSSTKHFFTAPMVKTVVNRELRQISPGMNPMEAGSTRHVEFALKEQGRNQLDFIFYNNPYFRLYFVH